MTKCVSGADIWEGGREPLAPQRVIATPPPNLKVNSGVSLIAVGDGAKLLHSKWQYFMKKNKNKSFADQHLYLIK